MALINWNENMSVDVEKIDQQHQKLVAMINDLNDAMKQRRGNETIGQIVGGLMGYTATHFKTEETYFDQFGYPEADQHKKEHTEFVQKVSEFKDGFDGGKLGLSIEVIQFLSNWLKNHIMGTDKKYTQFFKANGL